MSSGAREVQNTVFIAFMEPISKSNNQSVDKARLCIRKSVWRW